MLSAERFFSRFRSVISSGSEGRFVDAFGLIVANVALESHAVPLNVDLKFELVIFGEISLKLMSVLVVLLKLRDKFFSADNVLTYLVVLIVLPLDQLQGEVLFAQLVVAGQVEV